MSKYVRYEDVGRMALQSMSIANGEWAYAMRWLPTIDICFCRECKHSEYREDHDDYLCSNDGIYVHDADWFCADGERDSGKPNNLSEKPTGSERSSE